MAPEAFWRLSVPEAAALLAPAAGPGAADVSLAADLRRLMERFRDGR